MKVLGVEVIADPTKLKRGLKESQDAVTGFEKSTKSLDGHVKKLHGSLLGLSATLIGGGGIVVGFKDVVEAAKHAQESEDHLRVTMEAAGVSYKENRKLIEEQLSALSQLSAFQKTDLRESYVALVRVTKDATEATKLNALAADIARGRHISLEASTALVIKAHMGLLGPLRRSGIELTAVKDSVNALTDSHKSFTTEQKNAAKALDLQATKLKAIDTLTKTYAGQAKTYGESAAGASDRFHVSLRNIEVQVGSALMPTLAKYLTKGSDWLNQLEKSGQLQRDVNGVLKTASGIIGDITPVVKDAADGFKGLAKMLGGNKQAFELLAAVLIGAKFSGGLGNLGVLGTRLKYLKGLGVITIGVELLIHKQSIMDKVDKTLTGWRDAINKSPLGFLNAGNPANGQTFGGASNGTGSSGNGAVPGQLATFTGVTVGGGFLPQGASYTEGRSDQGRDFQTDPGGRIVAPGSGYCIRVGNDPGGFGPDYPIIHMTSGKYAGRDLYIGHCHSAVAPGQSFRAGQTIAFTGTSGVGNASVGGWAEIGFAPGGSPGPVGQGTPFGKDSATGMNNSRTDAATTWNPADGVKNTKEIVGAGKARKVPWVGLSVAGLTTAKGSIAAMLNGIPGTLDPIEQNAVSHIEALRDALHVHMTPAELAKDKVELAKWGKVLHEEITKNARAAAAAAAEAKQIFDRTLGLDMSHVMRDLQEKFAAQKRSFDIESSRHVKDMATAFAKDVLAFDRETQRTLGAMNLSGALLTPDEQALKDFQRARAAREQADRETSLGETLKGAKENLANAPAGTTPADIADLKQKVVDAQREVDQAKADEVQQGLQDAADASRIARDKETTDAQQAYQDQRDAAKQALQDKETDAEQAYSDMRDLQWQKLQDINDDQATKLQDNLNDWTAWIGAKKKTYSDFLSWASGQGIDTGGMLDPNANGGSVPAAAIPGTIAAAAAAGQRITHQLPKFASGGYVGKPTVAVVGDSPGGEYMVPAGAMAAMRGGGVTINLPRYLGSREEAAREIHRELLRLKQGGASLGLS